MGSLTRTPRVYVDAQILIYSGELDERYWSRLREFWLDAESGRIGIVTSELSVLECLVYPLRVNDTASLAAFESMFARPYVEQRPIDVGILRTAARLRADVGSLRTPDAIHAATALASNTSHFLTNDAGFRQLPGLNITYLGDGAPQFS